MEIKAGDATFALPVWEKNLRLDGPAPRHFRRTPDGIAGLGALPQRLAERVFAGGSPGLSFTPEGIHL
jgi:hypothetical protein